MTPAEALQAFFAAENARDWDSYRKFLHPEVRWTLHGLRRTEEVEGIEAYMARIQAAYAHSQATFVCQQMTVSAAGQRIAALLCNDQGARALDIFDFEDGLIRAEYEFLLD